MASIEKDHIILGDTYNVHYTCWKKGSLRDYRNQDAFTDPSTPDPTASRTPLDPLVAEVYLIDMITQLPVPLGATTDEDVATVNGNDVSYLIPADKFAEEGDYRVYVRLTFADGQTITAKRTLNVTAMS